MLPWMLVTVPCSLGNVIMATWVFHNTDPNASLIFVKYFITVNERGVGVRDAVTVAQRVQTDFKICAVITTRVPAGNTLSNAFRNSALLWC